jgi:DNA-binding NarL/FixJ family response regulator
MLGKKKVKLLVVDDHNSYCDLIEQSADIWNNDYEVECSFADCASDAFERIIDFTPNIIMVDAYLHDMNYLDFIDQCREGTASLVVTSSSQSPSIERSVIEHGARAYIAKTDDPDEIEDVLQQLALYASEIEATH